jgi:hypothetical protein
MKNSNWFQISILLLTVIVLFSCEQKKCKVLPPPPAPIKFEIRLNGKKYNFITEKEMKRFLDSVRIRDTTIHHRID